MKILDVAEFYSERGGGVRTYVEQKFEAAKAAGHRLCVIAPGREDRVENISAGKLFWVKSPVIPIDRRYHLFWRQKPIDEIINAERPDFIEGSSPWRGAWFAGRQSPAIPKALVVHQDPVLTYPHTFLGEIFSAAQIDALFAGFFRYFRRLQDLFDTTIVASPWLGARLSRLGLRQPQIVPFGVDQDAFAGAERSEELRRAMLADCGINHPNARLLVTISRHHPEKRIPMMIEAARQASYSQPIGLYIIGDGPSRSAIERLAIRTPGVRVAGYIGDRERLAEILASADAYLHACPTETFGMVIAEAMAAGLPMVVPSSGGAADLASPECAEFFTPDDAQDCADAIIRLLRRDAAALRASTRRSAARLNSTSDHFRALFLAYEKLAERKPGSGGERRPASAGASSAIDASLAALAAN
ncbi:MAG: glycosyltransferase [Alphaproteobacteria bacterium]|nr:glycosyltransferase [Alphaproteobacteria bacterium]